VLVVLVMEVPGYDADDDNYDYDDDNEDNDLDFE